MVSVLNVVWLLGQHGNKTNEQRTFYYPNLEISFLNIGKMRWITALHAVNRMNIKSQQYHVIARQRPCSFYKDGSLEQGQQDTLQTQDEQLPPSSSLPLVLDQHSDPENEQQDLHSPDSSILFAETSSAKYNKLKRRGPYMESRISNLLASLGDDLRKASASADNATLLDKLSDITEPFGDFIVWMSEPSLPSRYSGSIEMPSREIQLKLIDHFFDNRHRAIGLLPRFYFYQQLETKGLFITPLLLNTIYAHAARFVNIPDCPPSHVFYHRAKRLVDDFLDLPRVSTIAALNLLSLYELSPDLYRPGAQHCRSWIYSGMACRMCLELGLYDDSNIDKSLSNVDIEVRRRIFWACYELDKFQSGGWERPWMISKSFSKTRQPTILPEESPEDQEVVAACIYRLKFVFLVENGLNILLYNRLPTSTYPAINDITNKDDERINCMTTHHIQYQQWLRSLPKSMQWTPINAIPTKDILKLPVPSTTLCHIHLYYNVITLDLLLLLPTNSFIQYHSRMTAACITQLAYYSCNAPASIVKFDFIAHAVINAIKVHIFYLNDPNITLAQESWALFDRCIWCLQTIRNYAVIPNCTKFLQQIQTIYGLHSLDSQQQSNNSIFEQDDESSPPLPLSTTNTSTSTSTTNTTLAVANTNRTSPEEVPVPDPMHFGYDALDWQDNSRKQETNLTRNTNTNANNMLYMNEQSGLHHYSPTKSHRTDIYEKHIQSPLPSLPISQRDSWGHKSRYTPRQPMVVGSSASNPPLLSNNYSEMMTIPLQHNPSAVKYNNMMVSNPPPHSIYSTSMLPHNMPNMTPVENTQVIENNSMWQDPTIKQDNRESASSGSAGDLGLYMMQQ
ncbi:hypothetical protein K501DRAFT_266571 [Backusella circina FSU 941]|nr:hypothetical protein K501DRAFT_266571 [Backusella circina FSU 941]